MGAVDGSIATSWSPSGGKGSLTVTLQKPAPINEVRVTRGEGSTFGFTVNASADGTHWWKVGDAAPTAPGVLKSPPGSVPARYVRIDVQGGEAKEAVAGD